MQTSPDLWTVQQAAEVLRVKPLTVKRWIYGGNLPATRIGRRLLIRSEDVQSRLEQGTVKIVRGPAPIAGDLDPLAEPELTQMAEKVLAILMAGRWPVDTLPIDTDGIKKVLTDQERPSPIFWRRLLAGIEAMTNPQQSAQGTPTDLNDAFDKWKAREGPHPFKNEKS